MKPVLDKLFKKSPTRLSNTDAIIGKTGVVKTRIQTPKKGLVKVQGEDWTASSLTEEVIEEGEIIIVRKIEGVTLYVEKTEKKQKEGGK